MNQQLQGGRFISFEGIDGAGKSTHISAVAEALRAEGHVVTLTREPGGTELAEKLRDIILHDPMDALTEALLIFAARRDHITRVIAPALARGETVISDRFTDASFAYQGGGRGFDWEVLSQLEHMVQQRPDADLLQPDLTLWFDLAPAVAAARLAGARVPDRFEAQPQRFFEQVAAGYVRRAAQSSGRFIRIDADASAQQVGAQVHHALLSRGWLMSSQASD
jgi:dTMP kinase